LVWLWLFVLSVWWINKKLRQKAKKVKTIKIINNM
jgi:hypothetical protein